jgi:hypothetical protein
VNMKGMVKVTRWWKLGNWLQLTLQQNLGDNFVLNRSIKSFDANKLVDSLGFHVQFFTEKKVPKVEVLFILFTSIKCKGYVRYVIVLGFIPVA